MVCFVDWLSALWKGDMASVLGKNNEGYSGSSGARFYRRTWTQFLCKRHVNIHSADARTVSWLDDSRCLHFCGFQSLAVSAIYF